MGHSHAFPSADETLEMGAVVYSEARVVVAACASVLWANSIKDAVRPPRSLFWLICWWKVVLVMSGLGGSASSIIGGNINFYFPLHGAPTSVVFCRYSPLALNFLILVVMFLGALGGMEKPPWLCIWAISSLMAMF